MHNKHWILFITSIVITVILTACGQQQAPAGGQQTAQSAAPAAKTYEWKMVTTWPPNFPIFQEGVERFAENVKQMSNGRLSIKVYAGGELLPPL